MNKLYDVYGVKTTDIQNMRFNMYLEHNNIAMNTFKKEGRTEIAEKWLINNI